MRNSVCFRTIAHRKSPCSASRRRRNSPCRSFHRFLSHVVSGHKLRPWPGPAAACCRTSSSAEPCSGAWRAALRSCATAPRQAWRHIKTLTLSFLHPGAEFPGESGGQPAVPMFRPLVCQPLGPTLCRYTFGAPPPTPQGEKISCVPLHHNVEGPARREPIVYRSFGTVATPQSKLLGRPEQGGSIPVPPASKERALAVRRARYDGR